MTSFNGFYVVVTIMMSFTLLLRTSFCSEIPQPPSGGPSNDITSAPRPLSSYEKYLSNCSSKLKSADCGKQIYDGIFVGNQAVSDYCCHSLLNDVGKSCHYDMTRYAVQLPAFAKSKTEILKRNEKVWNDCSATRPILP